MIENGTTAAVHPAQSAALSSGSEPFDLTGWWSDLAREPFSPEQRQTLDQACFSLEAASASLQSGITVVRLDLNPKENAPFRLRLPTEISLFGSVQRGSFSMVLPDLGRQIFRSDDWFLLRTRDLQVLVEQPLSLLLFAVDGRVLQKLLAFAAPDECQTLRCFTCPQLREPSLIQDTGDQRLVWLGQQIEFSSPGTLDQRLALEARCLDWLRELLHQPALSTNRLCDSTCTLQEEATLREVAAYLDSHLEEEHTLADLSRRFNLNEFKLKRGFKSLFGITVFRHLRQRRIEMAAQLLKESDRSVLEIANAVGYSNPSHFARNFKDQVGLLPKAYQCIHRRI